MKINNKGFMLAEVIITSTIVVTAMIGLYTSFNKIYNNYRLRNTYYNIDGIYATKSMINSMTNDNDSDINSFINTFYGKHFEYIVNNGECSTSFTSSCSTLNNLYSIENMIFVEYAKDSLQDLKSDSGVKNQTFQDYIDYVIDYYGIKSASDSNNSEYSYIILTELKVGEDDYYYSNLRMR